MDLICITILIVLVNGCSKSESLTSDTITTNKTLKLEGSTTTTTDSVSTYVQVVLTTAVLASVDETVQNVNKKEAEVNQTSTNVNETVTHVSATAPNINVKVTKMTGTNETVVQVTEMTMTTTTTGNENMSPENTTEDYFTSDTTITEEVSTADNVSIDYSTATTSDLNTTTNGSDVTAAPQTGDDATFGDYQGIEAVAAVSIIGICAVIIVVAVVTARLERPRMKFHLSNEFSNPTSERQQANYPNTIEVNATTEF